MTNDYDETQRQEDTLALLPLTIAGATAAKKTKKDTAIVFWLRLVISFHHHVPTVWRNSDTMARPHIPEVSVSVPWLRKKTVSMSEVSCSLFGWSFGGMVDDDAIKCM